MTYGYFTRKRNSATRPFLKRCLELAAEAAKNGESPAGSVVVKDGIIIGEGFEQSRQLKDITRHAETVAILDAIQKGSSCPGATIYSNVEPCIQFWGPPPVITILR